MTEGTTGTERSDGDVDAVLRIQVLGGFRVAIGPLVVDECDWGLRKASALVKLLALTPGHRLHRERVIDALWPDLAFAAGNNSLHRTLHAARHALNPTRPPGAPARYLTLRGDVLTLGAPERLDVDADAFRAAAAEARRSRDATAYRRAIALYGGDLLPDNLYDDWSTTAREELREHFAALLAEAARAFIAQGAPDEAIQTLRRLVAVEPTREDAHVALMRLLARLGRRYDALRQYQLLRTILHDELAAEPDPATQQVYEQIQAGRFSSALAAAPVDSSAREARPAIGEHKEGSSTFGAPGDVWHDVARAPAMAAEDAGVPAAPEVTGGHSLALAALDAMAGNVTSFVGRVREGEELASLLEAERLVTVVGPGGGGKTRLVLHTAARLRPAYSGGVTLVELGAWSDGTLVPQAVAQALGIREQVDLPLVAALAAALAERTLVPAARLLLVLDNCEHLRDACARLAEEVLAACPRVTILATSRRPLGIAAEVAYRLRSLETPDSEALPPFATLLDYDAIRLFVERAAMSRPNFALTAQNADAVVRICQRLDGLPLAIELAAGRRRVLGIAQIADRLDDALALLGGGPDQVPRHATIRATIAWSWELLSAPERTLLRRLAVFSGGWTLEAAEAICGERPANEAAPRGPRPQSPPARAGDRDEPTGTPASDTPSEGAVAARPAPPLAGLGGEDPNVLDLLARLVEQSLVVVVEHDETIRYRLLDTIRQYAALQLREAGEEESLRLRHATWMVEFMPAAETGLQGGDQDLWLARLDVERDNLRAALEWACAAGLIEIAGRIAGSAARYWHLRGTLREGQRWLKRILALDDTRGHIAPVAVRAFVLQQIGLLAQFQDDLAGARAACEESLRLWRVLGNLRGMDESLSVLGGVAESRGDYARAAQIYGECLDLAREQGDLSRVTLALSNVADQSLLLGDLSHAEALYSESLALAERIGNRRYTAMALTNLGRIALRQGGVVSAEAYLVQGLAIMRELRIPRGVGEALRPLGEVALARGETGQAIARFREALDEYLGADAGLEVAQAFEGLGRALTAAHHPMPAVRVLAAANALRERLGTPRAPDETARFHEATDTLRTQLGDATLTDELARGREMPIERLIAALDVEEDVALTEQTVASSPAQSLSGQSRRGTHKTPIALTAREREIAALVAAGLTNREIAARLRIAPRTADTHVANVLAKLRLRSRAEVGPWLRANP